MAHTAAAKAGVGNLTKTLAVEWAPCGVRVNALAPGLFPHEDMRTDLQALRTEGEDVDARRAPAGRLGRLHELGWAATWLCSPYASFVTGPHPGGRRRQLVAAGLRHARVRPRAGPDRGSAARSRRMTGAPGRWRPSDPGPGAPVARDHGRRAPMTRIVTDDPHVTDGPPVTGDPPVTRRRAPEGGVDPMRVRSFLGLTLGLVGPRANLAVSGVLLTLLVSSRVSSAVAITFALTANRLVGWLAYPVLGRASDRTRSAAGRRAPYMAAGLFIMGVCTWSYTLVSGFWLLVAAHRGGEDGQRRVRTDERGRHPRDLRQEPDHEGRGAHRHPRRRS